MLSPEEVARLIDAASNLQARAILMTLYSTGVRRSELVRLRVQDIDSERMVVHIRKGKGGKDRDLPLCTKRRYASTGAGRSRRPTCFPVAPGIAELSSQCRATRSGTPVPKPLAMLV